MVNNYADYSSMDSQACADNFTSNVMFLQYFSYLIALSGWLNFPIMVIDYFYPFQGYIEWCLTSMDGYYHCAANAGHPDFNLADGTWDHQLGFVRSQLAKFTALGGIPFYGIYLKIATAFGLASSFGTIGAGFV